MNEVLVGTMIIYAIINIILISYMIYIYNDYKNKIKNTKLVEIEIFDNLKEYFHTRIEKVENSLLWQDFNPNFDKEIKRGPDGKFNPHEVPGILDDLFGEK